MYCTKKITSDLIWLGGSDRRLALFENVYPIPRGVSYNAYLIQDEKTALLDTVDQAIAERFFENLEHALQGKPLNYVIVNHMEPDHAATLGTVLSRYPEATVIGNAKTLPMIKQFFPMEVEGRFQAVKEGDTLSLGRHELTFVMAPLVHWPEVMMTYDTTEKALFSADAFGTFGAMDGNIFADEVNFEQEWLDDARRYYTNIVGKYGTPVQNVLKKAAGLDIQYLCPLHGPIWRENIGWFLEKYKRWSTYTPEAWTAAIFCGSIYGHTENACEILASRLAEKGVRHVRIFDVSHTDVSEQVSAAFQCSHLVFASASGVELYFAAYGALPRQTTAVCIGEVTARALRQKNDSPMLVAQQASPQGIVDAILRSRGGAAGEDFSVKSGGGNVSAPKEKTLP